MYTNITKNVTLSFSGKRKYEQLNRLEPELETLFQKLDQAVNSVHFQLLTGCADGADQIATSLVLKAPFNNTQNLWSTGGVFPFQQSDYVDTMDDLIAYEALYQRLEQKLHLDGHYVKGAEGKEARVKAYRQQGQVLARFADVFIAASTRSENINGGGTLENVIVALKLAKPVIFYDLQEHQFYLFQHVDEFLLKDDSNLNKHAVTVEELVKWFERRIRPEYDSDVYLIKPSGGLLFKCRKQAWNVFERLFYREKPRFDPNFRQPILEKLKIIYDAIEDIRRPISENANRFQIHYRGSYMLNYIAAMAAVCVAVLAMMYYIYSLRYWHHIYWPLIVLGLIKIAILSIIIINTRESNKTITTL
ncbi:hypothetical protein BWI96_21045 [Siphonobacter sp. SORGH_AS_0500]|uniref:hypothetical protein n=1 Tax=Siphonobacter sp. SORGH_AS_0500 TaxID=1864824 RepID=UPI000CCAF5F8|nr:hypothetical protein [Siphonobacter sp. SORGH_AS_0500]PKK34712.1 hypothetical protein BWI96_21045 [Siphonobacter sp. SORGH_AS_0500]